MARFYSTRKAAEILGVTHQHISLLCRRLKIGELVGRNYILDNDDMRALAMRKTKTGPEPKEAKKK